MNYNYERVQSAVGEIPAELQERMDSDKAKLAAMEELGEDDWNDQLQDEYDALEEAVENHDELVKPFMQWQANEMPFGGVILAVTEKGELVTYPGLVKNSERKALAAFRMGESASGSQDNGDTEASNKSQSITDQGYSTALCNDLSAHKLAITKLAIAQNEKLGAELATFSMCYTAFTEFFWNKFISVRVDDTFQESSKNDVGDSKANLELGEVKAYLDLTWVVEDPAEAFQLYRKLTVKSKNRLLAYVAALGASNYKNEKLHNLVKDETGVDYAQYWRPTADGFLKRLKTDQLLLIGEKALGERWKERFNNAKKSEIAENLEGAFKTGSNHFDADSEVLMSWMPEDF